MSWHCAKKILNRFQQGNQNFFKQFGLMSGHLTIMSNYRAKTEYSKQRRPVRSIYPNGLVRASERSERRHNNIIGKR